MQISYFIFILEPILQKNTYKLSNYNNWEFYYKHVNKDITINGATRNYVFLKDLKTWVLRK
jgi:hypothetical protein